MDLVAIPVNVCQLQDKNETKIEETYKVVHQRLLQLQQESISLRVEVKQFDHNSALLGKEEYCLDSKNKILEEEVQVLIAQTEKVLCYVEDLKWKIYKIELIKEFEQKNNESTLKSIYKEKENLSQISFEEPMEIAKDNTIENKSTTIVFETKLKISQLKEEIEKQKMNMKMTDPKLLTNLKMLENRNAALLLRYQRQISEMSSRYRQTLTEVNSLKRIFAEKNILLADI